MNNMRATMERLDAEYRARQKHMEDMWRWVKQKHGSGTRQREFEGP
jgi:hypothetical protein